MPLYRKLHVKVTESLDVNEMPDDFTRLFWVLLPLALCREGRGIDNPAWIKAKLFPLREDVTAEMITDVMDWLAEREMIVRYEVSRRCYFYVPTFRRYQGDTQKERTSDYPAPVDTIPDLFQTYSGVEKADLPRSASASASVNESVFNGEMNFLFTRDDVLKLVANASGMVAIPPKEMERIEQIHRLLESYGYDATMQACKESYQRWIGTPRKDGSGRYRGTNFGWVDWAQDILAGNVPTEKDTSEMTDAEFREWLNKKAAMTNAT